MNIVFSGFRDAALQKRIEDAGGRVLGAVSKNVDIVVRDGIKGQTSTKITQAKALGIKVMDRDEFVKTHFKPSIAQSIWSMLAAPSSNASASDQNKNKRKKSTTGSEKAKASKAKDSKAKTYLIHDNGGRPFKFQMTTTKFWVYKGKFSWDTEEWSYDKLAVEPTRYSRVFKGEDPLLGKFGDGNSMLVKLYPASDNKFMYVGQKIFTFTPPDEITTFKSPIGNSDVPYPYAIGKQNHYLMVEDTYLPNDMLKSEDNDATKDPYDVLYHVDSGYGIVKTNKLINELKKKFKMAKDMKLKVVQKRL